MMLQSIQSERSGLLVSTGGNLIIGIVGIVFAVCSSSQAILLDCGRGDAPKRKSHRRPADHGRCRELDGQRGDIIRNRAPSQKIVQQVEKIVPQCTARLPVQELSGRVIQPGRTRMVLVHVILPTDYQVVGLPVLDALRAETLAELKKVHPDTVVDLLFNSDRIWGAPAAQAE